LKEIKNEKIIFFLGGCFLLAAIIVFVNPLGNFPLNDDWHYAYPVKTLIENGEYQLHSYFSPNIFLQVIWGYLFCLIPNEFSFTYLRFSTLVTAFFCGFVFFQIIRSQKNCSFYESLFLTIFFVFNPLFFSLSFSFMTDVPFLLLCLTSIFFYKKYLEKEKTQFRILGGSLAIAALFIRQPGVLILIAAEFSIFLIYFFDKIKRDDSIATIFRNKKIFGFVFSILSGMLVYFFIENYLKFWLNTDEYYISVGGEYLNTLKEDPSLFIFQFAKRSLMTVFYMGLFCFPLISIFFEKIREVQLHQKWIFIVLVLFNLSVTYLLFKNEFIFPFGGNVFYNLGLGPVLLKDIYVLNLPVGFEIPNYIFISLGFICQILGCYIFLFFGKRIIRAFQKPLEHKFFLMLVLINILYLGAMMIFSYFDRYLLLLFVSILVIIYNEKSKKRFYQYRSLVILTILFGYFSMVATKDYLTWNRVSHVAYEKLISSGIVKEKIDAGLSRNGFEGTLPEIEKTHEYVLSFNDLQNYEQIESITFYRWLFLQEDQLLILKKSN
jgi:hypothetical protein